MTVPPEDRMSTGLILFLVFYSIAVVFCLYPVALMEWDERDRQFHQDEFCEWVKSEAHNDPDITKAHIDEACIDVPTWQDEVLGSNG
jgi:hypothetical protein